jgi:hypothetical protein
MPWKGSEEVFGTLKRVTDGSMRQFDKPPCFFIGLGLRLRNSLHGGPGLSNTTDMVVTFQEE